MPNYPTACLLVGTSLGWYPFCLVINYCSTTPRALRRVPIKDKQSSTREDQRKKGESSVALTKFKYLWYWLLKRGIKKVFWGLVAERFKAVVLKTIIAHTITSSNLVLPFFTITGCLWYMVGPQATNWKPPLSRLNAHRRGAAFDRNMKYKYLRYFDQRLPTG
jgi:hypothetical protein